MRTWQMQAAKAKLSDLVKHTSEEPQEITSYGKSVAVVLSPEQFQALSGQQSLVDFMQASPLLGRDDVRFDRGKSASRDVRL